MTIAQMIESWRANAPGLDLSHRVSWFDRMFDDVMALFSFENAPRVENTWIERVVFASMLEGPAPDALVALVMCPPSVIDAIAPRMRAAGLWTDAGYDISEFLVAGADAWTFSGHALVARGRLMRRRVPPQAPEYRTADSEEWS